jgi:hypothetical protein
MAAVRRIRVVRAPRRRSGPAIQPAANWNDFCKSLRELNIIGARRSAAKMSN